MKAHFPTRAFNALPTASDTRCLARAGWTLLTTNWFGDPRCVIGKSYVFVVPYNGTFINLKSRFTIDIPFSNLNFHMLSISRAINDSFLKAHYVVGCLKWVTIIVKFNTTCYTFEAYVSQVQKYVGRADKRILLRALAACEQPKRFLAAVDLVQHMRYGIDGVHLIRYKVVGHLLI